MPKWISYITSSILKCLTCELWQIPQEKYAVTFVCGCQRAGRASRNIRMLSFFFLFFSETIFLRDRLGLTLNEQKCACSVHLHGTSRATSNRRGYFASRMWCLLFYCLYWFSKSRIPTWSHNKHVCGVRKTGHAPQSQPTCENSHPFTHPSTHSFIYCVLGRNGG